ncbi:MAG: helix-turn-helix domain-containing protein [Erysipelotrichaceae bacterium]|nr:helix-turn-helix domain-containing protein [Erysipelotrichaceae bacterium]
MTTGELIWEKRIANNFTQDDLAEILKVTRQTISSYETDRTEPDLNTIRTLAELFNCSTDSLLNVVETSSERKINFVKLILPLLIIVCIIWLCAGGMHKIYLRVGDLYSTITITFFFVLFILPAITFLTFRAVFRIMEVRKENNVLFWITIVLFVCVLVLNAIIMYNWQYSEYALTGFVYWFWNLEYPNCTVVTAFVALLGSVNGITSKR